MAHWRVYDHLKQKDDGHRSTHSVAMATSNIYQRWLPGLIFPRGEPLILGMNILKAEAFFNKASVVLDTIRFSDQFRTGAQSLPK